MRLQKHFQEKIFCHELISNSSNIFDKIMMTILQCLILFLKLFEVFVWQMRSRHNRLGRDLSMNYVGFDCVSLAKHTQKEDIWVVTYDRVLNVSTFLPQYPDDEKDASVVFDLNHSSDVIEKYTWDVFIDTLGEKMDQILLQRSVSYRDWTYRREVEGVRSYQQDSNRHHCIVFIDPFS